MHNADPALVLTVGRKIHELVADGVVSASPLSAILSAHPAVAPSYRVTLRPLLVFARNAVVFVAAMFRSGATTRSGTRLQAREGIILLYRRLQKHKISSRADAATRYE